MTAGRRRSVAAALLAVTVLAPFALAPARAGEAGDYAYLFVQGRITDASGSAAVAGARVRLTAEAGTFEQVTDRRGVFLFDRLPVATYEVAVTGADGKPVRGARQAIRFDPERARIEVDSREGQRSRILVETDGDDVEIVVQRPSTHWKKLWKELAVFVGVAGLFAL